MVTSAVGRVLVLTSLVMLSPLLSSTAAGQEPDSTATDVPAQVRYDVMASALRHAIEHAREEGTIERLGIEYFCVGVQEEGTQSREDPGRPLFELFRGMRPPVVPISDCEVESPEGYPRGPMEGTSAVDHKETEAEAIYLGITNLEIERETAASVSVWYFVGPLHAVGFECDVNRKVVWSPDCRMTGRA